MKYGSGWGVGDASRACDARTGNCSDFHAYFIALARAIGIPARLAIGAAIPSERHDGKIDGYHCWAEFFADGKWWPVDISEADKFQSGHLLLRASPGQSDRTESGPRPAGGPVTYLRPHQSPGLPRLGDRRHTRQGRDRIHLSPHRRRAEIVTVPGFAAGLDKPLASGNSCPPTLFQPCGAGRCRRSAFAIRKSSFHVRACRPARAQDASFNTVAADEESLHSSFAIRDSTFDQSLVTFDCYRLLKSFHRQWLCLWGNTLLKRSHRSLRRSQSVPAPFIKSFGRGDPNDAVLALRKRPNPVRGGQGSERALLANNQSTLFRGDPETSSPVGKQQN